MLSLETLLKNYRQSYPQESPVVDRFLEVIAREPRCFERDCPQGHITGSAWLMNQARDSVLLTHHAKLDKWMQLGGHSDGDPHPWQVALREAREESGIDDIGLLSNEILDIDVHTIPARKNEAAHEHFDIRFACVTLKSDAYAISEESKDLKWVPLPSVPEFSQETTILRMRDKYLKLSRR